MARCTSLVCRYCTDWNTSIRASFWFLHLWIKNTNFTWFCFVSEKKVSVSFFSEVYLHMFKYNVYLYLTVTTLATVLLFCTKNEGLYACVESLNRLYQQTQYPMNHPPKFLGMLLKLFLQALLLKLNLLIYLTPHHFLTPVCILCNCWDLGNDYKELVF